MFPESEATLLRTSVCLVVQIYPATMSVIKLNRHAPKKNARTIDSPISGPAVVIPLNSEGMGIGEWIILFSENFEGMGMGMGMGMGNSKKLCA